MSLDPSCLSPQYFCLSMLPLILSLPPGGPEPWDRASRLPGLMTPCPQSTWSCCCSSFNCSACGYGNLTCSPDVLPCPGPAVFDSLSTAPAVSNSECSAMKSQLTFTPEVLTCFTLYNHCDYYYLTLLVIYERLNILTMYCYNLNPAQPEEDWPTLMAWLLSMFLPRFSPFL